MTRLLAIAALVLLTAGQATAETPSAPPKRIETAWLLSGATTAAGIALMLGADAAYNRNSRDAGDMMLLPGLAAVVAGPSVGHWYAGKIFTLGLGIHTAALGALLVGLMRCGDCNPDVRTAIWGISGAAWAGGAIYDFATLGLRVRARNASVALAPIASADRIGLALAGSW